MSAISDSIGNRFERIVKVEFPDFRRVDNGSLMPDFSCGNFFTEAKTGFMDFGVQIKRYQVRSFQSVTEKPVVYVIGFHNFGDATSRLGSLGEEDRAELLDGKMEIVSAYFVSADVVDGIWRREHKVSVKDQRVYCTLKERFLKSVIENGEFRRKERTVNARRYYGVRPARDFLFQPIPEEYSGDFPYGHILHRERDSEVISYLWENDVLDGRDI